MSFVPNRDLKRLNPMSNDCLQLCTIDLPNIEVYNC